MLTITEIAGFAGAGLAGAAYIPQISHLIRARCSAGISRLAFEAWLLASLLTTARAIAIHAGVFIAVGGIQIVATALIMLCAIRYKDMPCPVHLPRRPAARTARGRAPQETSPGPGVRPAGRTPGQPHPPGTAGRCARTSRSRLHSDAVTTRPGREPDVRAFPSRSRPHSRCGAVRRRWQAGGAGPAPNLKRPT